MCSKVDKVDQNQILALEKETLEKHRYIGYLPLFSGADKKLGTLNHLVIQWLDKSNSFRIDDSVQVQFWAEGDLSEWFRPCWQKIIATEGFVLTSGRCSYDRGVRFGKDGIKKKIRSVLPRCIGVTPLDCCLTMTLRIEFGKIHFSCLAHDDFSLEITATEEVAKAVAVAKQATPTATAEEVAKAVAVAKQATKTAPATATATATATAPATAASKKKKVTAGKRKRT